MLGLILCLSLCPFQVREEGNLCHLAISSELKYAFQKGEGRLTRLRKINKPHKSGKARARRFLEPKVIEEEKMFKGEASGHLRCLEQTL